MHEFGLDRPLPVQYGDYVWQRAARRPRHLARSPTSRCSRSSWRASRRRSSSRSCAMLFALRDRHPGRHRRRGQAQHRLGLLGDGRRRSPATRCRSSGGGCCSSSSSRSASAGRRSRAGIAIQYDIAPVTGFMLVDSLLSADKGAFRSALSHLILPAIVLGTIPLAVIARMTRSSMLEVLREDYVRTARAKGAGRVRVVGVHALRNALIPVVTTIGLQVGTLLAGAILTETIFSWPGIGKWLVEAIHRRDYAAVQGGILMHGDDHHRRQPDRRRALRRDQSAHPPCMTRRAASPLPERAAARRRAAVRAAVAGARALARLPQQPRRGRSASSSSCLLVFCALFADVIAPHDPSEQFRDATLRAAVADAGRRPRLPARHRPGRPRHPLAPDPRHALSLVIGLVVGRPVARRSASCSAWSPASTAAGCRVRRSCG